MKRLVLFAVLSALLVTPLVRVELVAEVDSWIHILDHRRGITRQTGSPPGRIAPRSLRKTALFARNANQADRSKKRWPQDQAQAHRPQDRQMRH